MPRPRKTTEVRVKTYGKRATSEEKEFLERWLPREVRAGMAPCDAQLPASAFPP
jgi:hypothetical protein